jgi:hypothetical protein
MPTRRILGLVREASLVDGPSVVTVAANSGQVVVTLKQPRGRMVEIAMTSADAMLLGRRLARSALLMPAVAS